VSTKTREIDGTIYKPTKAGVARLEKPHWYHAPSLPKFPTLPAAPKARRDKDVAAWSARLVASYTKAMQRADEGTNRRLEDYIGRAAGGGYVLVASDGHRAVVRKGKPTKKCKVSTISIAVATSTEHYIVVSDELALAVNRMRAAGDRGADAVMRLDVDAERGIAIVTTKDHKDGTSAGEWLPVTGKLRTCAVMLNTDYFAEVFGLAGLRVSLPAVPEDGATYTPVCVETPDRQYRVLVMPKGELKNLHDMPAIDSTVTPAEALPEAAAASSVSEAPAASVTARKPRAPRTTVAASVAPSGHPHALSPGIKAWLTRRARIDAGEAKPTDWSAAGRKAAETRRRNAAAADASKASGAAA
jgi:hypothetical protein